MKNVIAYVRVSTDAQAMDDKFGIESQKEIITNYCEKNDMFVTRWYIDKGESGVKEHRPQLDAIIYGDISNPPVEAVVIAKSDRISRDMKLYYYLWMLLEKRGIDLISATEEIVNDDTGLGNVYKALMLFVAEQERKNINKRTSGGRAVKSASGGYSGGRTPFGYKAENHQMVVEPEEAEVVREIFRLKDGEGMTYQAVADALNQEGKVNRSGKPFIISTIQTIYENKKVYQGMYRYGKRSNKDAEWVKGQHEPILKEESL